jgi:transposase-like protein
MIEKKQILNKDQIIKEYLAGGQTFKELGRKYDLPDRTIQTWVRAYRKSFPEGFLSHLDDSDLRKQLARAELKNELLAEMLRLASEHTGIDLRKKFGAKQS